MAIKFALLGCGRIGVLHARNLAKAGGAQLEIVFDPNTTAAETIAGALANEFSNTEIGVYRLLCEIAASGHRV